MSLALTYIRRFFTMMTEFVFQDMVFSGSSSPVSVGWVIVCCIIFGMVVKSVLVLPQSLRTSGGSVHGHDRSND